MKPYDLLGYIYVSGGRWGSSSRDKSSDWMKTSPAASMLGQLHRNAFKDQIQRASFGQLQAPAPREGYTNTFGDFRLCKWEGQVIKCETKPSVDRTCHSGTWTTPVCNGLPYGIRERFWGMVNAIKMALCLWQQQYVFYAFRIKRTRATASQRIAGPYESSTCSHQQFRIFIEFESLLLCLSIRIYGT